jgi:hypothetical protein
VGEEGLGFNLPDGIKESLDDEEVLRYFLEGSRRRPLGGRKN